MIRVRTGYSFRQAAGKLPEVFSRLKEIGAPAFAITDRASTFGWTQWDRLCRKNGVKPVFGVELAVTPSINEKKPATDHWTFIAGSSVEPINRLVALATEQFRYTPLLTYEQALSAAGEGVAVIVGHRANLALLAEKRNKEPLYLGVSPAMNAAYYRRAMALGFLDPVAVSDNRYPRAGDQGLYEVLCGRDASSQTYPQWLLGEDEWLDAIDPRILSEITDADAWQAVERSKRLLNLSTATLQKAEILKPKRVLELREMCWIGAGKLGVRLGDPVYMARLDRELSLIAEKNFEDYFYLVADLCQFARERMIVGPARGSSCGSLVCYLLGITTVDPIPYGLIFERFIDVNRDDLPDIDIDFSDTQRPLVFEYLNQKYGATRVARLGAVAMFKSKSALQEAGAALKIPKWKTDKLADVVIAKAAGDERALNTLEDALANTEIGKALVAEFPEIAIVSRIEGHPRHYSQHAAGVVISERPVSEIVAIDHRTGGTMCDKRDAEDLNLLKIDALGLTQLSVFEEALQLARLPMKHLDGLSFDDPAAFDVLNKRQFAGIFQFNGSALQGLARGFKADRFEDLVSVTALARPGPLGSGGAHEWVKRRAGEVTIDYPHAMFKPYLEETLGVIVYQEQVMSIAREIGEFDWGQVTALRKAMAKSLGREAMDRYGEPFKAGAIANGLSPTDADRVWDMLVTYGAYGFNKSHSVAYAMISYYCLWLKAHHPFEFAAASLTFETDPDKQLALLREIVAEGFDYVPIDPEQSTDRWSVGFRNGKRTLVGPLSNVKGIGPRMVAEITGARARGERMPDKAVKLLTNPVTPLDDLFPIAAAIKRVAPDIREKGVVTPPTPIAAIQCEENDREYVVLGTLEYMKPGDENEPDRVAKRNGRVIRGDTQFLSLRIKDDSDTILARVDRFDFNKIGKKMLDLGRVGKSLFAFKVRQRGGGDLRFLNVLNVRHLGDMEALKEEPVKEAAE